MIKIRLKYGFLATSMTDKSGMNSRIWKKKKVHIPSAKYSGGPVMPWLHLSSEGKQSKIDFSVTCIFVIGHRT